jgi:hypothetical protein
MDRSTRGRHARDGKVYEDNLSLMPNPCWGEDRMLFSIRNRALCAALCAGTWLVGCHGDEHRARDGANGQPEGDAEAEAGERDDRDGGEVEDDGASDRESDPMDGATVQPLTDGGARDAAVLGTLRVPGPPFLGPTRPVRRLAIGASSVCVILEDRRIQCVDSYEAAGGADSSAAVPDNHDFVLLAKSEEDYGPFIGIRADGTVATWAGMVPMEVLPGSGYIDAFGSMDNLCGLKNSGEIVCVGKSPLPSYPAGPYLAFAGRTHNVPKRYAGLRADGVIVANPQNVDGGVSFIGSAVFVGIAMRMEPPFCGIVTDGSVYCAEAVGIAPRLVRQPFSNVRDVSYGIANICAVLDDGRATCNTVAGSDSGYALPKDKRFVDIDTRDSTGICGTTEAGELWCWTNKANSALQIALPMKAAIK